MIQVEEIIQSSKIVQLNKKFIKELFSSKRKFFVAVRCVIIPNADDYLHAIYTLPAHPAGTSRRQPPSSLKS